MPHKLHWRKPVILSIIFHIFFVIGTSYLVSHMPLSQAAEEKYVELELMNTVEEQGEVDSALPAMPRSAIHTTQPIPLTTVNQPITSPSSAPSSVTAAPLVTSEPLTVTSVSGTGVTSSSAESAGAGNNATTTKSNGSGIIPPSILNRINPTYPQSARQAGIEGTVILKIQIHENGHAGNVTIFRSSGNEELDTAAISAVKQWRFVPAKDRTSNQPMVCYTTMPISFHLK